MVDCDPLQAHSQIPFDARKERAGKAPQVLELHAVFRRDDEAKLVAIIASRGRKGLQIDLVSLRVVGVSRLSPSSDAVPGEITHMAGERPGR